MLTVAQQNYLYAIGKTATIASGVVKGGEGQYADDFSNPNAVNNFRVFVKKEISNLVDHKINKSYSRAYNPRYLLKGQQALNYKLNGYRGTVEDFQYLKEEAAERKLTLEQMANLIISAANTDNAGAASLEKRRIKMNLALDAASTIEDVNTIWRQAEIDIEAL